MLDDPKVIERKIKRAVTDTDGEVRYDPEAKPGVSNLLSILAAATGGDPEALAERYAQYGPLKADTAEAVVELLRPVQERYAELAADPAETARILAAGADKARKIAGATDGPGPRPAWASSSPEPRRGQSSGHSVGHEPAVVAASRARRCRTRPARRRWQSVTGALDELSRREPGPGPLRSPPSTTQYASPLASLPMPAQHPPMNAAITATTPTLAAARLRRHRSSPPGAPGGPTYRPRPVWPADRVGWRRHRWRARRRRVADRPSISRRRRP